jgi:hypothetical protein
MPKGSAAAVQGGRTGHVLTTEEQDAAKKLKEWRTSLSMEKIKAFRKMYEDAGVLIQILKIDNFNSFSDEVIDYFFLVAKNPGLLRAFYRRQSQRCRTAGKICRQTQNDDRLPRAHRRARR